MEGFYKFFVILVIVLREVQKCKIVKEKGIGIRRSVLEYMFEILLFLV